MRISDWSQTCALPIYQVVGVFDAAVVGAGAELHVLADAVELEQPVFEALRGVELPAAQLSGFGIPGDHRLGARATGRGADADYVGQRGLRVRVVGQELGRASWREKVCQYV